MTTVTSFANIDLAITTRGSLVTLQVINKKTQETDTFQVHVTEQGSTYHILLSKSEDGRMRGIAGTRELIENIGDNTWVSFGDVARDQCGMQAQYCSHYVDGFGGKTPKLGEGLRFRGKEGKPLNVSDYHDIEIHADDVEEFVKRVTAHRMAMRS